MVPPFQGGGAGGASPRGSRHGAWAITNYGLECPTTYYPIEAARLWKGQGYYGWERHMSEKVWVNMAHFLDALEAAREHHQGIKK